MNTQIHRAETRGHVNHGWLDSNFSFSFAEYYNPERVHFGKLRVINDDVIAPKMGFGLHPHENMEIITIPLQGIIKHEDNTGNKEFIRKGEIQVMSAGTGIWHSEYNGSDTEEAKILQVWIFPEENGLKPGYKTKAFNFEGLKNSLLLFAAPRQLEGDHLIINQDAYISYGKLDAQQELNYKLYKEHNGVYVFIISGALHVNNEILNARDGMSMAEVKEFSVLGTEPCEFVLFEIPMH